MIKINLLPFRLARKKENIRRQVSVFLLLLIFTAAVLYYGNSYWNAKIKKLDYEVTGLDSQLKTAMAAANEVDKLKKELDDLAQKIKVIESLKADSREPVQILDAMTRVIVEKRMWFTNFSAVGKTISIKGIALDNKTVADFMKRLENSGLFSSVNLGNLKQQKVQTKFDLKQFDITCQRAVPVPEKTDKTKAKVS